MIERRKSPLELINRRWSSMVLLMFAAGVLIATMFLQAQGGLTETIGRLALPAAVFAGTFVAYAARQRGYPYAGSVVFLLFTYLAIVNYVVSGRYGLHSYTPAFFLLLILGGAVFIGQRAVIWSTALAVATTVALYSLERFNIWIDRSAAQAISLDNIFIAYLFLFCTGGGLAYVSSRGFRQALDDSALQEERFRQLFQAAPLGFIMHRHGRVVMVNTAAAQAYGSDAAAMHGIDVKKLLPPEQQALADENAARAAALMPGENLMVEYERIDRQGRTRWIETLTTPVSMLDGPALLTIARDVTRERAAAAALASAKEAAEAANQTKSQFLANMSHEIRTPMNAVLGLSELLLADSLSPAQRERALGIRTSAKALLEVINDVLDVSRIEAGRTELIEAEFSLARLFDELQAMLRPLAGEKSLIFEIRPDSELPHRLFGDAGRLRQILVNLAGNAIKFTERGSVTVEVSMAAALGPEAGEADAAAEEVHTGSWPEGALRCRGVLRCRVLDTGPGIAPAQIATLFERFTQADTSNTRRHGGTGLGLYLSRQFARMLDGDIEVQSVPGVGSCFELTVRLAILPEQSAGLVARIGPRVQLAGRPLRLLLVEDNLINRMVARTMLEAGGHRVSEAEDGAQAVACNAAQSFDCVLMDCQMPVMDGIEATRRIRLHEIEIGRRRTPIVALTANAMRGDRERYLAAGMDAFLAKPFESAQLLAVVAQMVYGSDDAASAANRDGVDAAAGAAADVPARVHHRDAAGDQPAGVPVFDSNPMAQLERLDADSPGLLGSLVTRFLADTPRLIAQIGTGGAAADVERAAHSLKSTCGRFGARQLSALAVQAEQCARNGDVAAAQLEAASMLLAFERFDAEFRAHPSVAAALAASK